MTNDLNYFDFDSTINQPNGYLKFKNINALEFIINSNLSNKTIEIEFVTKNYKFLKIYNGIAGII